MEDLIERVRKFCEDIVSNASEQVAKHGAAGASVESARSAVACDILGMIRNAPPAQPAFTADEVRAILGEVGILTSHGNAARVTEKLAGRAVVDCCSAPHGHPHAEGCSTRREARLPSQVLHMLADYKRKLQAEPSSLPGYDQTEQEERRRWIADQIARIDRLFADQQLETVCGDAPAGDRAQREADLREAFPRGCTAVRRTVCVTDSGAGPSVDRPSLDDVEERAAEYARSKAGQ